MRSHCHYSHFFGPSETPIHCLNPVNSATSLIWPHSRNLTRKILDNFTLFTRSQKTIMFIFPMLMLYGLVEVSLFFNCICIPSAHLLEQLLNCNCDISVKTLVKLTCRPVMRSSLACGSKVCVTSLELFPGYLILAFPFGTTGNKFKIQTYLICSTLDHQNNLFLAIDCQRDPLSLIKTFIRLRLL